MLEYLLAPRPSLMGLRGHIKSLNVDNRDV